MTLLTPTHNPVTHFLQLPALLRDKYQNEPGFNLFTVLRGSSDEVRLHSRFIAELLNPKGSHNMGKVFLQRFLETLDICNFNTEGECSVEKEWDNIDILIRNQHHQAIIIENKLYASDQDEQLFRYFSSIKNERITDDNINLIYLTLNGKAPDEQSLGSIPETFLNSGNYQLLSYAGRMQEWLKACQKEAVNQPALRESIGQYIELIQQLTHTGQSERYMNELKNYFQKELLAGNKPVSLLDDINQAKKAIHAESISKLARKIEARVEEQVSAKLESSSSKMEDAENFVNGGYFGVWYYPDADDTRYCIGVEAYKGTPYLGAYCQKDQNPGLHEALSSCLANHCRDLAQGRQTKSMAKWKYHHEPIRLQESSDKTLIQLIDEDYTDKLADDIAADIVRYIKVLQEHFQEKANWD